MQHVIVWRTGLHSWMLHICKQDDWPVQGPDDMHTFTGQPSLTDTGAVSEAGGGPS